MHVTFLYTVASYCQTWRLQWQRITIALATTSQWSCLPCAGGWVQTGSAHLCRSACEHYLSSLSCHPSSRAAWAGLALSQAERVLSVFEAVRGGGEECVCMLNLPWSDP